MVPPIHRSRIGRADARRLGRISSGGKRQGWEREARGDSGERAEWERKGGVDGGGVGVAAAATDSMIIRSCTAASTRSFVIIDRASEMPPLPVIAKISRRGFRLPCSSRRAWLRPRSPLARRSAKAGHDHRGDGRPDRSEDLAVRAGDLLPVLRAGQVHAGCGYVLPRVRSGLRSLFADQVQAEPGLGVRAGRGRAAAGRHQHGSRHQNPVPGHQGAGECDTFVRGVPADY